MRHLWETMSGSGDSGTGTKPTPCHIHTHPTTSHTPHAQQAPRPRPRLFCQHSPICTQPTGTPRCPAPTRRLSLVPHPIYPNRQNPPRHIPAKRTQPAQPHPPLPPRAHQAARPHQTPRPRIRTTHALKTQTTSPKTLQIHSISPKWSALWAHTVQLEARRRRHNGCAYDLHHCGARTLHHRCEQH